MRTRQISGFYAILILGFLLISGCSNTASTGTNAQPTITPTVTIPTTLASTTGIQTTLSSNTAVPATSASPAPQAYSTSDINKHFVDVAFGSDNLYISKWTGDFVDIGISGAYNDEDVKKLNNFTKLFNSYSSVKLGEVAEERKTANIVLNFLPESSLKNVNLDNSWKISRNRETDTINYIYKETPEVLNSETIYINSDLKGDRRTHWILRALLYELGFAGETGTYTDSIFYSESDTGTSLSKIDLKALELMYGKKISNGMTLTGVRQLLLIENT